MKFVSSVRREKWKVRESTKKRLANEFHKQTQPNNNMTKSTLCTFHSNAFKKSDCPRSEERPNYNGVHDNVNALSTSIRCAFSNAQSNRTDTRRMGERSSMCIVHCTCFNFGKRNEENNHFLATWEVAIWSIWLADGVQLEFDCRTDSQSVNRFGFDFLSVPFAESWSHENSEEKQQYQINCISTTAAPHQ